MRTVKSQTEESNSASGEGGRKEGRKEEGRKEGRKADAKGMLKEAPDIYFLINDDAKMMLPLGLQYFYSQNGDIDSHKINKSFA